VTEPDGTAVSNVIIDFDDPTSGATERAVSDRFGRFESRRVAPGQYLITASKAGYVTTAWGQHGVADPAQQVTLESGSVIPNLRITIRKGAVVSGRVVERGEPVPGADVTLVRRNRRDGRDVLIALGAGYSVVTDDGGRFRIIGVPPGEYAVVAKYRVAANGEGYAPTYVPDVLSDADPSLLMLGVGGQANVQVSMARTRLVTVAGTVTVESSDGVAEGSVRLEPKLTSRFGFGATPHVARVRGDGAFQLTDVPVGEYSLVAVLGRRRPGASPAIQFGMVPVQAREPVSDLRVPARAGWSLRGVVTAREGCGADLSGTRIETAPQDWTARLAGAREAVTAADGSFLLDGLFGSHLVYARLTPSAQTFVSAVTLNGVDVSGAGVIGKGEQELEGLQLTIGCASEQIRGRVTTADGEAVRSAIVVAFPRDERLWEHPFQRYVRATRSRDDGTFALGGLPSTDYVVVAVETVDERVGLGSTWFRRYASGVSIRVWPEGTNETSADVRVQLQ
jgi:hypothetical protein